MYLSWTRTAEAGSVVEAVGPAAAAAARAATGGGTAVEARKEGCTRADSCNCVHRGSSPWPDWEEDGEEREKGRVLLQRIFF